MELYVKLAELRKKSDISQTDAATRIGVSRQTVSKWESGTVTPDMKNLALIAEVYNVAIEDLLNEDFDISGYENTLTKPVITEKVEEEATAEEISEENAPEADEIDAEECEECCCCTEECEEEEEKPAERIYKQVKEKVMTAKAVAADKLSTIEIPKTAVIASLAAVSGTSAVLSAVLKKGKGKTAAAILAGAAFAAGAGLVIKDIYDRRKTCECCCEECEDDLCGCEDLCECESECACECENNDIEA